MLRGGKVAPGSGLGSLPKFVNSGSGGRARRRTSEQRGGARAGGRRDHSPEAAKRPEAQSSAPQSAASRRGPSMLGDAARDRGPAVQTTGLSLLLDGNKSGSAAPPTGPHAPPRPAGGGLRAGPRSPERRGGSKGPRLPPAPPHPASRLGPETRPQFYIDWAGKGSGVVWFFVFLILDLRC